MSDQVTDDVVDEMLAKAMLKLSFDERNAVNEELHGVKCLAIPENPEFLSRALEDFQREIDKTETNASSVSKKAYNMILLRREKEEERNRTRLVSSSDTTSIAAVSETVYTKNHYAIDDDDFRLRFLRVELFDVQKAVNRFLAYLNLAHKFWGEIALERPIYLKDLLADEDVRKTLKQGFHQILPFRDRSGRKIIVCFLDDRIHTQSEERNRAKVSFYVCDTATRDCVESQRLGLAIIIWNLEGEMKNLSGHGIKQVVEVMASMPVRTIAKHLCIPHSPFSRFLRRIYVMEAVDALSGLVEIGLFHFGTPTENRYRLKSFGIPTELIPLTGSIVIKLKCYNQWMRTRHLLEQKDYEKRRNNRNRTSEDDYEMSDIVEVPCMNDVVFRQGTSSLEHIGNVAFIHMILDRFEERRLKERKEEDSSNTLSQASSDQAGHHETKAATSDGDTDDKMFCELIIHEIEINRKGRFLEWNRSLSTWVHVKTDTKKSLGKLRKKILMVIYNYEKKASTSLFLLRKKNRNLGANDSTLKRNISSNDGDSNYRFIEGGQKSLLEGDDSCFCDCSGSSKRHKNDTSSGAILFSSHS